MNKDTNTDTDDWKKELEKAFESKPKLGETVDRGWICPKCGRANAPWKASCDCSNQYYTIPYYPMPHYPPNPTVPYITWCHG